MATTAAVSGTGTTGVLTAPGVGSGLDVKSLVSQLMAVENQPLKQLATKEAAYQTKLTNLGSIKGGLSTLQSAAQALSTASTTQYSATPSDTSVLTTTGSSQAIPGTYSVNVSKLALAQKLIAGGMASTSTAISDGTATTLTFTPGTITSNAGPTNGIYSDAEFAANSSASPVSVIINSSNNTLAGIRDAINGAGAGVTASIINVGGAKPYRLAIAATDTGVANSRKIVATGGDGTIDSLLGYDPKTTQNLTQTQAARDAELTVDGLSIASASNSVSDAIQGVTLNLAKENTAVSVSIQRDTSSVLSALTALVKAYNDSNTTIAGVTAKGADLQGDSGVLSVQYQMRAAIGGIQHTSNQYTALSQLGVSFQKDGTLTLDSTTLNAALAANPAGALSLTFKVANSIYDATKALVGADGPITSKTNSINASITTIGTRRTEMQRRLDATQARYLAQFTALDVLISNMNQTSAYLTQQLANLPTTSNKG